METRNLKISKETANRWYNGSDTELKQLALQTFPELAEKELPKSFSEIKNKKGWYVDMNERIIESENLKDEKGFRHIFATKEQAEASIALAQLSQLMKVYNSGWEADWTNDEDKFCIEFFNDFIDTSTCIAAAKLLSFKDAKTRDLFLENFRDLILTAKPLLG
jgi:hypothetical protein